MMRVKPKILTVVLFFFPILLYSQGAIISIKHMNGSATKVELLSVRPAEIVVTANLRSSEQSLPKNIQDIKRIRNEEILSITIESPSHFWEGAENGLIFGGGTGFLIGIASGDDPEGSFFRMSALEKGAGLGAFLGAVGAFVGGIFGVIGTEPDRIIEPLPGYGFTSIRSISRYPDREPEFLSSIHPTMEEQ